jgi:hypothetical protein
MMTRYLLILAIVERLLYLHVDIMCTYSHGSANRNQNITTVNISTVLRCNDAYLSVKVSLGRNRRSSNSADIKNYVNPGGALGAG